MKYESSWNTAWLPFVFVGCGGVLLGIPIGAPIFGTPIPDAAATLWGSALGSIAAIGGAFWLSDFSRRRECREIAEALLQVIGPVLVRYQKLVKAYRDPDRNGQEASELGPANLLSQAEWCTVREMAETTIALIQGSVKSLSMLAPLAYKLGGRGLNSYIIFDDVLPMIREQAQGLIGQARLSAALPGPQVKNRTVEENLIDLHNDLAGAFSIMQLLRTYRHLM